MEHPDTESLMAKLSFIGESPGDTGTVDMVVSRPDVGQREVLDHAELIVGAGLSGDNYLERVMPNSEAHPEAQLNLMMSRALDAVTQNDRDRWELAGDQLIVDFDLSSKNAPPGTKLQIGGAVIEVSQKPHRGCAKFAQRFGQDAARWTNHDADLKLRGINAMVIRDGVVKPGDPISKIG